MIVLDDTDVTIHEGDCLEVLRSLPDGSVHMCATSPPFYGLRDYGTGTWEGGDPDCDHVKDAVKNRGDDFRSRGEERGYDPGSNFANYGERNATSSDFESVCGKCGATRVDRQIGLEDTPEAWVERLVAVFREVRRVLRDDGTLWVEIGDSYVSGQGGRQSSVGEMPARALALDSSGDVGRDDVDAGSWQSGATSKVTPARGTTDLKPKDLLGQPWMLAFALRADGWYLRSEIVWARPNPMPESVSDRPTKSHSTVFLLTKRPRYFYDADAIREAFSENTHSRGKGIGVKAEIQQEGGTLEAGRSNASSKSATSGNLAERSRPPQTETLDGSDGEAPRGADGRRATAHPGAGDNSIQARSTGDRWPNPSGANARSVWTIPTEPTPFAHFATWPQKLVARMIKAGTSERGCCPECAAPWVRDTERSIENPGNRQNNGQIERTELQRAFAARRETRVETLGWSPSCDHDGDPVPCVVLDPFHGSGTTSIVARAHGRRAVGIELNPDYNAIARDRLSQLSLLS